MLRNKPAHRCSHAGFSRDCSDDCESAQNRLLDKKEPFMAITLDQVRRLLAPDEPNYASAAKLGPVLLPHLKALIDSGDHHYGSKAAYLASMIDHDHAVEV